MPDTSRIMLKVLLCLLPGALTLSFWFGAGVWVNIALALLAGALADLAFSRLRGPTTYLTLADGSFAVTAILIALAIPPQAHWSVVVLATILGLGIGKHAYGGLGQNLFNPAMVGYALVLVSMPDHFALWPAVDGTTSATALDQLGHRDGATVAEAMQGAAFGGYGGAGWEWVNVGFLVGGLALLLLRLAAWRIPVAMLFTLTVAATLTYDGGSSASHGGPLFHWLVGGTMLTAFFVATDPVTHPTNPIGQWLFGGIVGIVTFVIRAWGAQPDGLAFAVLFANACTPYLERRFTHRAAMEDV